MSAALLLFALVAFATIATPGPTVLLALTNGSRHGLRAASAGIAGALLSDVLLIAATALGLGAVLAASPTMFALLKAIGAAYLAWLGIGLLRSSVRTTPIAASGGDATGDTQAAIAMPSSIHAALFRRSLLVALANPKGLLFFSALLPQFIDPAEPQASQYAVLGLVFVLLDGVATMGYALVGDRGVGRFGPSGASRVNRVCGTLLLVLAVALATASR